MEQCWRWFGPKDPVSLADARAAGATGIVSALHETYDGRPWSAAAVAKRKAEIEGAGLSWSVVESIPVPNAIKLGNADAPEAITAFLASMRAVAAAGVRTICYNFMPVVDWTRTTLDHVMPSGGLALRFDMADFAAYDLGILARADAVADYPPDLVARAEARLSAMTPEQAEALERTIIAGLPGAEASHDRRGIAGLIAGYRDTGAEALRANLTAFHKAAIPEARALGIRLSLHPDDPPFPLFGLPRVVSTADDLAALFAAVPELENGLTFCTGSLGARRKADLPGIFSAHAERVHFLHLRNVTVEEDGSFVEDDHLGGDVDMVKMVRLILGEEARRRAEGRPDHDIPFRPDHGHRLLDEITRDTLPGYSAIGRLKGLAELRGVIKALSEPLGGAAR